MKPREPDEPRVAVLLSTYNGGPYLEEYLASLQRQEAHGITLLARDDGSNDGTLAVLKKYQRSGVKLLPSEHNLGPAGSFFNLLEHAGDGYDFYAFADQDDIWMPDKLSRALGKMGTAVGYGRLAASAPMLYCSRLQYVDARLRHIGWSPVPRRVGFGNALVENIATGCTIVINRSARELILSFRPEQCLMHDAWAYLVVSCFGHVLWDEYAGVKYRQHGNNVIGVPTTFPRKLLRRAARSVRREGRLFQLSDQLRIFSESFDGRIPEANRRVVQMMLAGKSSLRLRLRLACSREIWRQDIGDDLIMRLLILTNVY